MKLPGGQAKVKKKGMSSEELRKEEERGDLQARNQDFMWGGANETKVDQTTEMYFLSNSF